MIAPKPATATLIGYNFDLLDEGGSSAYTGELFIDSTLGDPNTFYSFDDIGDTNGGSLSITVEGLSFDLSDALDPDVDGVFTNAGGMVQTFHSIQFLEVFFFSDIGATLFIDNANGFWFVADSGNVEEFDGPAHSFTKIPEPSSMLLFGAGLIGLVGIGRRRRRKDNLGTSLSPQPA